MVATFSSSDRRGSLRHEDQEIDGGLDRVRSSPTILCLTPVKNESWILERFLSAASLWADHIIVADQGSSDNSAQIASQFNKVTLLRNETSEYDEFSRQQLLLNEARKFPEPRLLVALDADEFLVPIPGRFPRWKEILSSRPGSAFYFRWANIAPSFADYWPSDTAFPLVFMDDNSLHNGREMHSPRLPVQAATRHIHVPEMMVMHFQYVDWDRMESKHRWYQVIERVKYPSRSWIRINRKYHHTSILPQDKLTPIPSGWFEDYSAAGIILQTVTRQRHYWWDEEVLRLMLHYGPEHFAKEEIWDFDWIELAKSIAIKEPTKVGDPRGVFHRAMHWWTRSSRQSASTLPVRVIDKLLEVVSFAQSREDSELVRGGVEKLRTGAS
jgi:hypothetical protein